MICQDVTNWVKTCKRCKKAKDPYVDLNVKQGSIIANNLMDLLWLDFTTLDHNKHRKENVLIMMGVFSDFTVAVVMSNQQAKTIVKALVDRWSYSYGNPSRNHDKGRSFDNKVIEQPCKI